MHCLQILLVCAAFCWQRTPAQEVNFPTAQNIKWYSTNFKTIVEWTGEPTNFSYTVELQSSFYVWKRKCSYIKNTECDVTDDLKRVNDTYDVRITSEILTEDIETEEYPYANGPSFNPYEQTIIGQPVIQSFEFNKEHTQLRIVVDDPKTPYRFQNRTLKTIRDIFQGDFKYTVFYRKADSTGRKEASSATNEILINTSKGESYCLYVRATVPSRKTNRDSQASDEICTPSVGTEYDLTVLVAVGTAVALIIIIIILLVVLLICKKRKPGNTNIKETAPLNDHNDV